MRLSFSAWSAEKNAGSDLATPLPHQEKFPNIDALLKNHAMTPL